MADMLTSLQAYKRDNIAAEMKAAAEKRQKTLQDQAQRQSIYNFTGIDTEHQWGSVGGAISGAGQVLFSPLKMGLNIVSDVLGALFSPLKRILGGNSQPQYVVAPQTQSQKNNGSNASGGTGSIEERLKKLEKENADLKKLLNSGKTGKDINPDGTPKSLSAKPKTSKAAGYYTDGELYASKRARFSTTLTGYMEQIDENIERQLDAKGQIKKIDSGKVSDTLKTGTGKPEALGSAFHLTFDESGEMTAKTTDKILKTHEELLRAKAVAYVNYTKAEAAYNSAKVLSDNLQARIADIDKDIAGAKGDTKLLDKLKAEKKKLEDELKKIDLKGLEDKMKKARTTFEAADKAEKTGYNELNNNANADTAKTAKTPKTTADDLRKTYDKFATAVKEYNDDFYNNKTQVTIGKLAKESVELYSKDAKSEADALEQKYKKDGRGAAALEARVSQQLKQRDKIEEKHAQETAKKAEEEAAKAKRNEDRKNLENSF